MKTSESRMDPVVSLPLPRSPDQPHKLATRWESEAEQSQKVFLFFFVDFLFFLTFCCSEAGQCGEPACPQLQHDLPGAEGGDGGLPGQLPAAPLGLLLLGALLQLEGLHQHRHHRPLLGVGPPLSHPHPAQPAEGSLLPRNPAEGTSRPAHPPPLWILGLPDS